MRRKWPLNIFCELQPWHTLVPPRNVRKTWFNCSRLWASHSTVPHEGNRDAATTTHCVICPAVADWNDNLYNKTSFILGSNSSSTTVNYVDNNLSTSCLCSQHNLICCHLFRFVLIILFKYTQSCSSATVGLTIANIWHQCSLEPDPLIRPTNISPGKLCENKFSFLQETKPKDYSFEAMSPNTMYPQHPFLAWLKYRV